MLNYFSLGEVDDVNGYFVMVLHGVAAIAQDSKFIKWHKNHEKLLQLDLI
jgi:hypothetical protein